MAEAGPITLDIVTGFLGAGKTTLINRLLADPALADTAVIVNEFGEISIDHLLIETGGEEGIVELGDGCLCCTVRGALVDTLAELAARRPALRRVVVETTGLADPAPVLRAVMAHPGLSRLYRLGNVVTVVDAVNGMATLDAHEEARSQVALADRLVLSKGALAQEQERQALARRLARLNPQAGLFDADALEAAARLLEPGIAPRQVPPAGHHHAHHHDDHDHAHGPDAFRSVSLTHDRPLARTVVENFLDLLATQQGEHILRIKGLVETVEAPERPLLVQGAQRLLHTPQHLPRWPEGGRGTRIVVIGDGALDTGYIGRIFAAFAGEAQVDTPDRAALQDNPLAIPGFRR